MMKFLYPYYLPLLLSSSQSNSFPSDPLKGAAHNIFSNSKESNFSLLEVEAYLSEKLINNRG